MSLHIVAPGQPVALGHCEIPSGPRVPTLLGTGITSSALHMREAKTLSPRCSESEAGQSSSECPLRSASVCPGHAGIRRRR